MSLFQRYWPTVLTLLIGMIFSVTFGALVRRGFHDHDIGVAAELITNVFVGMALGCLACIVWARRNP